MTKLTELATGRITAVDTLTIEWANHMSAGRTQEDSKAGRYDCLWGVEPLPESPAAKVPPVGPLAAGAQGSAL